MAQIFLGIDPGIARTGYGVLLKDGHKFSMIKYGCITTEAGSALGFRLKFLYDELESIISTHKPDAICIEELFFSKNVKTALTVGQARGVIMLCAEQNRLQIFEFKPLHVKQSVSGYGGADKKQVQNMMKMLLGLKSIPSPDDAADALALAYCGASSYKHLQLKSKVCLKNV